MMGGLSLDRVVRKASLRSQGREGTTHEEICGRMFQTEGTVSAKA